MLRSVVFSVALLSPLPASAGWGGTDWGMTPAEVEATRDAAPYEVDGSLQWYRAVVEGIKVRIAFSFDTSGLAQIEVNPDSDEDCFGLMTVVRDTYGEPFRASDSESVTADKWADEVNGNLVSLFSMKVDGVPTSCPILYEPLRAPNSGGF